MICSIASNDFANATLLFLFRFNFVENSFFSFRHSHRLRKANIQWSFLKLFGFRTDDGVWRVNRWENCMFSFIHTYLLGINMSMRRFSLCWITIWSVESCLRSCTMFSGRNTPKLDRHWFKAASLYSDRIFTFISIIK